MRVYERGVVVRIRPDMKYRTPSGHLIRDGEEVRVIDVYKSAVGTGDVVLEVEYDNQFVLVYEHDIQPRKV